MEESAKVLGQAFMDAYTHPLLGRMPTAEEQAWSLLLLSSPLNAAVTGAVLATDEGNVAARSPARSSRATSEPIEILPY